MREVLLGILGGLGPMASAYFYELVTQRTAAARDQEHIDIILSSRASTPDRTDFIMGKSGESPLPQMIHDAKSLETYGATAILIPCNTAHYFLTEVRDAVSVPVPSIITETVAFVRHCGYKKAGIMATAGTVSSKSYQNELESQGLSWAVPDGDNQQKLMSLIYDCVKSGKTPDIALLYSVMDSLYSAGCDCVILACTELSVINRTLPHQRRVIDSLEVLAHCAITLCNHECTGFPPEFDTFSSANYDKGVVK